MKRTKKKTLQKTNMIHNTTTTFVRKITIITIISIIFLFEESRRQNTVDLLRYLTAQYAVVNACKPGRNMRIGVENSSKA